MAARRHAVGRHSPPRGRRGGQFERDGIYRRRNLGPSREVLQALLEGGAFFCIIAYMVTHLWWALAMAFGLLAAMVVFFPMRGRFDDWVREQRELRSLDQGAAG